MITCCVKGCSNQSRLNKNVSNHNQVNRKNIKFLYKMETTAIGISSMQNLTKRAENIFLHTSNNIKHLQQTKTYLSQEILRRDTLRISVAAIRRCAVTKVSLKILPPAYLHVIKIDTKQWTTNCLTLSKSQYCSSNLDKYCFLQINQ